MGRVVQIKKDSDNQGCIVLLTEGSAVNMTSVTRIQIHVDDVAGSVIDSDVVAMTWTSLINDEYPILIPGNEVAVAAGTYRDCHVRIFDGNSVDGLWWPDPVTLVIRD